MVSLIDQNASLICSGCGFQSSGTLDHLLDEARDHHDEYDHEPHKPSTAPDTYNVFTVTGLSGSFSIETSAKFARIVDEGTNSIVYRKGYSGRREAEPLK